MTYNINFSELYLDRDLDLATEVGMPKIDLTTRRRVVVLYARGYSVRSIKKRLEEENILISVPALYNLLKKHAEMDTIADLPRQSRKRKITTEMMNTIEETMSNNDELTARNVRQILADKWPNLNVSIPTVKRVRREMGWVCTKPHYCQLIREVIILCNTIMRLSLLSPTYPRSGNGQDYWGFAKTV